MQHSVKYDIAIHYTLVTFLNGYGVYSEFWCFGTNRVQPGDVQVWRSSSAIDHVLFAEFSTRLPG